MTIARPICPTDVIVPGYYNLYNFDGEVWAGDMRASREQSEYSGRVHGKKHPDLYARVRVVLK